MKYAQIYCLNRRFLTFHRCALVNTGRRDRLESAKVLNSEVNQANSILCQLKKLLKLMTVYKDVLAEHFEIGYLPQTVVLYFVYITAKVQGGVCYT